jgi:hypothetical protein
MPVLRCCKGIEMKKLSDASILDIELYVVFPEEFEAGIQELDGGLDLNFLFSTEVFAVGVAD